MKKPLITKFLGTATIVAALAASGWVSRALAAQEQASVVTSVFKVEGMTCGGCEAGVKAKVKKLEGVEHVEASYKEGRAEVTYDPKKVTADQIIAAIEELGYEAELVQEQSSGSATSASLPSRHLACC